jgi:hypothetical protein
MGLLQIHVDCGLSTTGRFAKDFYGFPRLACLEMRQQMVVPSAFILEQGAKNLDAYIESCIAYPLFLLNFLTLYGCIGAEDLHFKHRCVKVSKDLAPNFLF